MTDKNTVGEGAASASPKKKGLKLTPRKLTVAGVAAVVIAVGGFAFWEWHETPQFCAAICHNMDPYLETYMQEDNVPGTDKYGNPVSDTSAMLATRHRENPSTTRPEMRCMACHHPVLAEQVSEVVMQVSGNYYDPLTERVGNDLTHWEGIKSTQFCANENCHSYLMDENGDINRDKLESITVSRKFNPHAQHHPDMQLECTECHKGHRASVMVCSGCHEDAEMPSGWVSYDEGQKILERAYGKR
ncbi:salivary glue protein Sgs-3 [Eggerthellaceae bacterium zg-1084]|uniref:Salivary glue protein Sgs-3 n=1 Tax=Berryella wangjianweii TaxID=2734634 RepID=A0A6M8J576_9ACTN|nr:cytochrome c3 family protein [Berryella wangjianweii]NPD31295.1 salivary glue protein Sgs-3 [Berryella wangjianweii]NPD32396.1 salivary glue protein Sgs-3 [Eggerthellaceae bacterium zg-997]QKF06838.1 salivary glue protein Sgs-3 [Berryella wangjianweii]